MEQFKQLGLTWFRAAAASAVALYLAGETDLKTLAMAAAKSGNWWENNTQRALSNNSVAYSRKPAMEQFIAEWKNLYDSKSGERGIYNVAEYSGSFFSVKLSLEKSSIKNPNLVWWNIS